MVIMSDVLSRLNSVMTTSLVEIPPAPGVKVEDNRR